MLACVARVEGNDSLKVASPETARSEPASSTASTTPEKEQREPQPEKEQREPRTQLKAESKDAARAKLAYLLAAPPAARAVTATSRDTDGAAMEAQQEPCQKALKLSGSTSIDEVGSNGDPNDAEMDIATLLAENATLKVRLDRLAEMRSASSILGISSRECGDCGYAAAVSERMFVENKSLYCESCWAKWERCGWWKPSMRVSTVPPQVGASGLPEYLPEDAFSIPEMVCAHDDFSLMDRLKAELPEGKDFTDWHGSRHMGMHFEDSAVSSLRLASGPPTLRATIAKMESAFGIEASAARLNLYRSNADYKPFHADRGRDSEGVPQVTVGLSLGATRELTFAHWQTGITVSFPQSNGDVFAFTPELNKVFLHGVPRVGNARTPDTEQDGARISLILWGSRTVVQRAHDAKKLARTQNAEAGVTISG